MKPKLIRALNIILYMLALLYGSLAPSPIPGEGKSLPWQVFHNALHIPAYALLTLLLVRYFAVIPNPEGVRDRLHTESAPRRRAWWSLGPAGLGTTAKADILAAAIIAMAYGILMEYLQSFTPDRCMSLMDVGLNGIGVGMVLLFIKSQSHKVTKSQ